MGKKGLDSDQLIEMLQNVLGQIDEKSMSDILKLLESYDSGTEVQLEETTNMDSFNMSLQSILKAAKKSNLSLPTVIKMVLSLGMANKK